MNQGVIQSYRDLEVWQRARRLVKSVYELSAAFPDRERFGLTAQLRSAAISICSNIAEGWGRRYPAELIQFLRTANGSLTELETQLILSTDLGYLTTEQADDALNEASILGRQLLSLERSVKKRTQQHPGS